MTNHEQQVVDWIGQMLEADDVDAWIDSQTRIGPCDDYSIDRGQLRCPWGSHGFHGLPIGHCPGSHLTCEEFEAARGVASDGSPQHSYGIADLEAMRAGYSRYRPPRDGAPWMIHDSQISDGARWSTHGSHISEVRVSGTAGDPIHLLPAHRFWSCSPDGHLFTVTGVLLVRSYTNRIGPGGRSVTLDFEVIDAVIDFDTVDPEFPQIVGQPPGSVVLEEPGTDGEWAPVAMCGAGGFELEDNRDAIVGFGGDIVAVHVRTYAKMTVSTVSPGSSLYRAIGGCFDW